MEVWLNIDHCHVVRCMHLVLGACRLGKQNKWNFLILKEFCPSSSNEKKKNEKEEEKPTLKPKTSDWKQKNVC